MPVANLRVFPSPLSRGQSGNVILLSRQAGRTIVSRVKKKVGRCLLIIEIKEEFQRQSPGKGIFSQVRAVAFLVLMQRFRVETWQGGGRKGEISVSGIGCSQ